jgi:hypothetical protein
MKTNFPSFKKSKDILVFRISPEVQKVLLGLQKMDYIRLKIKFNTYI